MIILTEHQRAKTGLRELRPWLTETGPLCVLNDEYKGPLGLGAANTAVLFNSSGPVKAENGAPKLLLTGGASLALQVNTASGCYTLSFGDL